MILVRDLRLVGFAVVIVVLIAATAFGLWHVVVGGLLNGNPRAAGFGVVLAAAAGSLLAAAILGHRRRRTV
ncbi:MAG TPA: hypothetical protein VHM48_00470 [Candidatus Limnocylindrales bacterium]|nr:hypothetical protein [Candidatus Limnocylindrales bacterium]